MDLKSSLSIFWSESAVYIALYFGYALIVCSVIAGIEYYNQLSQIAMLRLAIKSLALLLCSTACFTLASYVTSWHSSLLGGELIASALVTVLWIVLIYLLFSGLIGWSGVDLECVRCYGVATTILLVAPFIVFGAFIFVLGSNWSI